MSCLVCFEKIGDSTAIRCSNLICRQVICGVCIANLVRYSRDNKFLPCCLREGCNGVYLPQSLPHDSRLSNDYALTLRHYYYQTAEERQKRFRPSSYSAIIEQIRQERQIYAWDRFPAAIAFIASVAMAKDLSKLKKTQTVEQDELYTARAYCSNYGCNGLRDKNNQCNACNQLYCMVCDRRMTANHSQTCKKPLDGPQTLKIVRETLARMAIADTELTDRLNKLQSLEVSTARDSLIVTLIARQKTSTMSIEKQDRDLLQAFNNYITQFDLYRRYENMLDELLSIVDAGSFKPKEVVLVIDNYLQKE